MTILGCFKVTVSSSLPNFKNAGEFFQELFRVMTSRPGLTLSPPVPTIVGMDSAYLQKIIARLLFKVSST